MNMKHLLAVCLLVGGVMEGSEWGQGKRYQQQRRNFIQNRVALAQRQQSTTRATSSTQTSGFSLIKGITVGLVGLLTLAAPQKINLLDHPNHCCVTASGSFTQDQQSYTVTTPQFACSAFKDLSQGDRNQQIAGAVRNRGDRIPSSLVMASEITLCPMSNCRELWDNQMHCQSGKLTSLAALSHSNIKITKQP